MAVEKWWLVVVVALLVIVVSTVVMLGSGVRAWLGAHECVRACACA